MISDPESIPNEEQLIDSYEIEKVENTCNDPISLNESEDDDYTQVKPGVPIEFKYDGTTLYFRLQKDADPTPMPNFQKVFNGLWCRDHQAEAQNVTKIVIGEGITALGNHNFEGGFNRCFEKVTEVELSSTVNKIGDYTFQNDSALQSIDLSNVTDIGSTALAGTGVQDISLSRDKEVSLGDGAFNACTELRSVTGGNIKLATSAFEECSKLSSFQCTTKLDEIPEAAFSGTNLTNFDFESVKSIGDDAFSYTKLGTISFKQSELTIGINAFTECNELSAICYPGTKDAWAAISGSAGLASTVTVHCKGDTEKPKAATCTESGLQELTCTVCGETYTDGTVIPALGHKYADSYTVDKEATCTEEGEQSKHCTREGCESRDDIQVIPINKDNHDYVAEVTTQPTCTKDGVRTLTCTRCKDVKTEVIPATGVHQWSDWKKTADATVFAAEQQERNCATCDKKETRTVGEKLVATATVSASSVTLKEKQSTGTVKVAGLANGDSITSWKSTNTKVFTVSGKADGTCKLTGVKKGTAKLEITLASGLKKTVTVKVQAKAVKTSKISGLAKKMTVKKGEKTTLKPVITPATSKQKVTYSSSNKKVATVSSKGVITAKKAGTAKITVKSGSKKVTVTVTVPKTKTTAIKVGKKVSVKKGKTYSLKAKTTPSNSDEKITYKTSNKKIATVSKSGKIKGVKKGTATITIKSGKIVKKVKVTVK